MRSKIFGMILGTAIGDSLGMPVETWGRDRILKTYPNGILKYETPNGHKWFSGEKAGSITDDTQLTFAVMKGLMRSELISVFNITNIAHAHVEAMKETTAGWGNSTRDSIRNIANGVSWEHSGKSNDINRGIGNGILMKLSPIVAWSVSHKVPYSIEYFASCMLKLSSMTHYTKMAAISSLIHFRVLRNICQYSPNEYIIPNHFLPLLNNSTYVDISHLNDGKGDDLDDRWNLLRELNNEPDKWDFAKIANEFKGSCYIYDSLPYVYAHWIKNHDSIQLLYDSINYGADRNDSDSNASMLGAMLGALHGKEIFEAEPHLLSGLRCYDELMELTSNFCDYLGI